MMAVKRRNLYPTPQELPPQTILSKGPIPATYALPLCPGGFNPADSVTWTFLIRIEDLSLCNILSYASSCHRYRKLTWWLGINDPYPRTQHPARRRMLLVYYSATPTHQCNFARLPRIGGLTSTSAGWRGGLFLREWE